MKKIMISFFLIYVITLFSYQIKIDYIENENIIEISETSTNITYFENNTKTNHKIEFKHTQFEKKNYILPKGPIKSVKTYENIIEITTLFPTNIEIQKNNKIIIKAKGKKVLNNEIFQFKNIKIKDLLDILLKELNFNVYYITDIPDKNISLNLKNFYPEDLFRILLDSTGIYYDYISTKDIYISKNSLYNAQYPIINSKEKINETTDEIEIIQTKITNIEKLITLINLQYAKLNNELYILKGTKDKIELIKNIISNIPKTSKPKIKKEKDQKQEIKNIIYKIFEYSLPQKEIIKAFNIEYTDISSNIILLKGFETDITLFENYYNKAFEIYKKSQNKSTPKTKPEKKIKKVEITEEPTYIIIKSKYKIEKIEPMFKLNIQNIDKNIYIIKGIKKEIEKLKTLNDKINNILPTKEPTKIITTPAKITKEPTIINTEIPIENLSEMLNLEIKKIFDNVYIVKGEKVDFLKNIISKIQVPKETKINENNNIKDKQKEEKIEIIESNLNLLAFNKIFKDTIIQKIEKNYIIKGTDDEIKIIKEFNEKYNIKEIKKTSAITPVSTQTSNTTEKTKYKTLYELTEEYAKNNNLSLINEDTLKSIKLYNPENIQNIEKILSKNGYYLEKEKNVIIVKKSIPQIISIEISIVDSSILEETIRKIESKITSKSLIESISQGIINPLLYKEILDTAFNSNNTNSKSNSRLLSKPKIILKSGTKATFKSVYRVPVIQENSIQYIESGLTLEVQANYLKDTDLIDLEINLKVGEPEKSAISGYNAENSREINTKMLLKNGYVSILGGLKIIKEEKLNTGIPFLKDLPIIGFLFKTNEQRNREYDLNLFIWPKLVNYGGD
ncbi:type II and III secretion system protein [Marinitoga hydrogenitolerans DSM 16785]|uniref:Type II and III secretion system protein n=1 Tax=Marinitoga hydrogenitolerans (strain DSM 16785 / JCM 12826 / AT1271) TaxID=1122195 RepID=A0A1M5AEW1_MARH1|nr:hypothetical protein [Marinitoga hydrogenitolerans]SHF28685.1 type II and III secretion system protein [Marinitoga hydrogenitolerans DSM 16785]